VSNSACEGASALRDRAGCIPSQRCCLFRIDCISKIRATLARSRGCRAFTSPSVRLCSSYSVLPHSFRTPSLLHELTSPSYDPDRHTQEGGDPEFRRSAVDERDSGQFHALQHFVFLCLRSPSLRSLSLSGILLRGGANSLFREFAEKRCEGCKMVFRRRSPLRARRCCVLGGIFA
jgi:hypothetical protein